MVSNSESSLAPLDCGRCPRLCNSRRVVVNGFRSPGANILVVGQGPGKEEERFKPPQPLVGWSGDRLVYLLAVAGIIPMPDLDDMDRFEIKAWYAEARATLPIHLENVTRCRGPRMRGGDSPPTPVEIANCAPYLLAALAENPPAMIITLGAPALKWFLPKGSIAEIHGKPFTVQYSELAARWDASNDSIIADFTIMVVPMYHPAAGHKTRNPELVAVMLDDWERLGALYREEPQTQLGNYSGAEVEAVSALIKGADAFAFDFETTDPRWRKTFQPIRANPIGVSVATQEGSALYLKSTNIEVLRQALEDPTIEVWAHNAVFEYIIARGQGIQPRNLHDTKGLAHVLRRPSTALKRLTWTELGVMQTGYDDVDWDADDEVIQYGSADSDLTWRLKGKLVPEVEAAGLWDLYEMERALIPVLGEMQIRGVCLNPEPLYELGEILEGEQAEILEMLAARFPSPDPVNFNSDKQLREVLYGPIYFRPRCTNTLAGRLQHAPECVAKFRLSCVDFSCVAGVRTGAQSRLHWLPPGLAWKVTTRTKKSGEPATDMDTIRSYRDKDPDLVDALVKLASIHQCLTNNVARLPELVQEDGRVHSSFHSMGGWEERPGVPKEGPMTDRLSSSGHNWQNMTHHGDSERPYVAKWAKYIRRSVIATPGLVLVAADIGQEEPRIAAWDAGEDLLLWELDNGDVYCPVATEAFGRKITRADVEERQIGKRNFMAWLNGAGPSGIQQAAFWLDNEAAQRIIDWLGAKYAKIEARRADLVRHLQDNGYTSTFFGHRVYRHSIFSGPGPARNHAIRSVMPDFIQGTAAGVVKTWMPRVAGELQELLVDGTVELAERLDGNAHLLLSVHDELVIECAPELVPQVATLCQETLNGILPLHLPCEVKTGPNWSDLVEV